MTDKHEEIREFLNSIPDEFNIMEEGIDFQTHKEYIEYSDSFESGELTEEETLKLAGILFNSRQTSVRKKKALTLLAHLGSITAFRQIEKYYKNPDKDLKQWTALALQECKMLLESKISDESTGFISSGLGGLQDKMRFYYLVLPASDTAFTPSQKNIIKEEIKLVAKEMNCIVETVDTTDNYAALTILVPMDVAVGPLIETAIKKCNEFGDFVLEHYYVTNMNIPDALEINDIIKKVKE